MWPRAFALLVAAVVVGFVTAGSGSATEPATRIVTYPAPTGRALSSDYIVRARPLGGAWSTLDVHGVLVDRYRYEKASMVSFDTTGPVEIEVTKTSGTMRSARVRPLSYGIVPVVAPGGTTATFVLPRPVNVSFEVNEDLLHNLHLLVGPVEKSRSRPGRKTIVFGPGRHVIPGKHVLPIPSRTTVRIAGGAVVEGSLDVVDATDVVIEGRGIIDPSRFFPPKSRATIRISGSSDVGVRGITLLRGQDGAITIANSSDVVVASVREINADPSSDGVYVVSSRNVLVDDVFLRTSDDAVAVYATTPWFGGGGTRNVTVRNSTLWTDAAHVFFSGTHGDPARDEVISHLALQNIDILEHNEYLHGALYQGALALNPGNRVTVRDVRFDDIRIEDFSRGQVVNFRVFKNRHYNSHAGLGIRNVVVRNVRYAGAGDDPSRVRGYTASRRVANVTFEDFVRNGLTVLRPADGNVVAGPHVTNVIFRTQPPTRLVDAENAGLRYTGRWALRRDEAAAGASVRAPTSAGDALAYAFSGRQARLVGSIGPDGGQADVYVDGAFVASIDAYSPRRMAQQTWFDTGVLPSGRHRIELRFTAQKNVLSAGSFVGFDRLEIVS